MFTITSVNTKIFNFDIVAYATHKQYEQMLMAKVENPLFFHRKMFFGCVQVVIRLMKYEFDLMAGGGGELKFCTTIHGD